VSASSNALEEAARYAWRVWGGWAKYTRCAKCAEMRHCRSRGGRRFLCLDCFDQR
jgi:hypothetical protein